ncbi:hypothetical protein C0J52_07601 [Blattella germanica]|nr:hypothetical protein C0J52_07601 [Blattella germanica]
MLLGDALKRTRCWLTSRRIGDGETGLHAKSLGRISRAADGRFVLADSSHSSAANSISSSSDDGGFLPRRRRASWRRPLVGYPSQLSLRSDTSGSLSPHYHPPLVPAIYSPPPAPPPRFRASSPLLTTTWSPSYNFSDLSSVPQLSSVERSLPTPPSYLQLRSVHERYSQELPSLRAIHEAQRFLPVHPLATSSPPRVRIPPPRPRARLPPRHARHARSAPELADPDLMETSPSSSSGFGSKNTSQQNQSSSTSAEWRLPPYRPPPPPPPPLPHPPHIGRWLEFASASPPHSEPGHEKTLDASVDDHYEFDTAFAATPTPSTPTALLRQRPGSGGISDSEIYSASFYPLRAKRPSKYDNIEARVQAMKEEFHEFRKRQAKRRRSEELESAC